MEHSRHIRPSARGSLSERARERASAAQDASHRHLWRTAVVCLDPWFAVMLMASARAGDGLALLTTPGSVLAALVLGTDSPALLVTLGLPITALGVWVLAEMTRDSRLALKVLGAGFSCVAFLLIVILLA